MTELPAMAEHMGYPSRISSALRSHVATRYVSLAIFFIFVVYQVRSWSPHATSIRTEQVNIPNTFAPNLEWSSDTSLPKVSASSASNSETLPHDFDIHSPEPSTLLQSRIGKMTAVYYDVPNADTQAYERALLSHKKHDTLYGYKHYVQRRPTIEGIWSKMAYPIHLLVQELNKPPAERLDWLFWHDADVVLLNHLIPLESFLPPDGDRWAHVNLIVTNDLGGLNDGVFLVRVCEWSVRLFAAALSFPYYRPEVGLRYESQTAIGFLLEEDKWKNNSLHVPQRWFNPYHNFGDDDTIPPEWNWRHDYVEPEDLLVHLPGTADGRTKIIHEWLERLQTEPETYVVPLKDTKLPARLNYFWDNDAATEYERQDVYWRRYHILNDIGSKADDARTQGKQRLNKKLNAAGGMSDEEIEAVINEYEEAQKEVKKELLRDGERAILNGTKPDNVHAD